MPKYVLDTNFFIQAHRAYYPLDVVLGFWSKLQQLAEDGKLISIDKVRDELYKNNDPLTDWCKANLPEDFFKSTATPDVMTKYREIVSWAHSRSSHYQQTAIDDFMRADNADAFLVSYTLTDPGNLKLVTYETSSPEMKRAIKIPEPCDQNGVSYITPIEMLRELGESF